MEYDKSKLNGFNFDLSFVIRNIKKWFIASLCVGIIFGVVGFVYMDHRSQTTYTAKALVTIAGKSNNSTYLSNTALTTALNRNVSMWNSKVLKKAIYAANPEIQAYGSLSASVLEGTGMVQLKASASTAKGAYFLLSGAIQNYRQVAPNFDTSYRTIVLTTLSPSVIESYTPTTWPYGVLGFAGGLCLCLGIVVLWSMATELLHSEEQAQKLLDAPVLGCLAEVKSNKKDAKQKDSKQGLIWNREQLPMDYLENMDMLVTRLEQTMHHEGKKVLMVTSALANDGKTTLASNLSLALAGRNRKVLLVEMDLRNPSLYRFFKQEKDEEKSWFYSIQTKLRLANYVIPCEENPNLGIVYQFQPVRDSDRFIENSPIGRKVERLNSQYDYIIFDTPPMGLVRDTEVIARFAECSLVVTRQDLSYAGTINDCIERLEKGGATCIGVVLNVCKGITPRAGKKDKKDKTRHGKRGAQEKS